MQCSNLTTLESKCQIRFQTFNERRGMLNGSLRQLEHRQVPSKWFHCDLK